MATAVPKRKADLKVVIMGDSSIGKTTLIHRYLDGKFTDVSTTIGASFFLKQWGPYNVAIWDTAGEEKFSTLSSFYCRNASAAILAYDICDRETFDSLQTRHLPLLEAAEKNCLAVAVGTKLDLVSPTSRQVSNDAGEQFAVLSNPDKFKEGCDSKQRIPFFETSSLTGENIDNVFLYIFSTLLPLDREGNAIDPNAGRKRPSGVVDLDTSHPQPQQQQSSPSGSPPPPMGTRQHRCC
ncbi:ras-related protein Rab-20-like [Saccoglossus kowalevskii]|uniref:Ras-related protein Rab-20-like n=1 Tax=Saccoglossus kowalevskii TaxID=10224 RepID=A0ABM0GIH1_SACKO|nr:PREDICTED: ras-related protein Rab-20-like [Saccoglossus kowalevskii]